MTSTRQWLRRCAVAGSVVSAGVLVASVAATPASADAPSRTAWWGAPDPATPAGGIHVAVAPQQLLAYGAVALLLPSDGSGSLTLTLSGSEGSGSLQACPTNTDTWQSGDGQPMASAPGFDCSAHAYQGIPSSDGKSVTFYVDDSAEKTPGTLSLAIVPVQTTGAPEVGTDLGTDATEPYNVEIAKPDSSSFAPSGDGTQPSAGSPAPAGPPPATAPQPATGAAAGSVAAPPAAGAVPSLGPAAQTVPTSPDAGTAPVVAGQATPTSTGALRPAAAGTPSNDNRARDAALGLLALLVIALLAGNSTRRPPRRLGGAARHAATAPAAVGAAPGAMAADASPTALSSAQAMAMAQLFAARGLGRFAKPRFGPPRPLT